MMNYIFTVLLVATGIGAFPFSQEWSSFVDYVREYKKPYQNESTLLVKKFDAFKLSLIRHEQLNSIESQRKGTAVYGINKFSDLTQEEFRSLHLSTPKLTNLTDGSLRKQTPVLLYRTDDIPTKFDWRNWNGLNTVTSINNQKSCGSCWAFSAVETIESALSIKTKQKPQKLSAQQLISCEVEPGKLSGCDGGNVGYAYDAIVNKTVIVSEKDYPFASSDGKTYSCKSDLKRIGVMVQKYTVKEKIDEETEMVGLVSQVSPTSNAVDAMMWQDYKEGIIQHHCDQSVVDHAVQVVGYSLSNDPIPYWIVRNSWGSDWGEDGYLRVSLGSNTCGITYQVAAVNEVEEYT